MKDMALEQTQELAEAIEEEGAAGYELTAEEAADDRLADLLLTAWTALLREEQDSL